MRRIRDWLSGEMVYSHSKVADSWQQTQRALTLEKRKPTDADRPPLTTFPGPKRKPLPGQLDIEGLVTE